jgi:hypothetical protein
MKTHIARYDWVNSNWIVRDFEGYTLVNNLGETGTVWKTLEETEREWFERFDTSTRLERIFAKIYGIFS